MARSWHIGLFRLYCIIWDRIQPSTNFIEHLFTVANYIKTVYQPTQLPSYPPNYLPTYLLIYIPTYLHTHIPTYLLSYLPTYLLSYLPTYLLTHLLTYLPTQQQQQSGKNRQVNVRRKDAIKSLPSEMIWSNLNFSLMNQFGFLPV